LKSVKKGVERPADPEIFLDILLDSSDASTCRDEQVPAISFRG
jgi:hypothetical protein